MEFYVITLCLASFLLGVLVATIISYLCDTAKQEDVTDLTITQTINQDGKDKRKTKAILTDALSENDKLQGAASRNSVLSVR